jgi:hypothetical protein
MGTLEWRLYEVNNLLLEAIHAANLEVDEESGEIPEDWANFIDDIQLPRNEKCINIARYIKNLRYKAEAVDKERIVFAKRVKSINTRIKSLEKCLINVITPGEELEDNTTRIHWRESSGVVIDNPDLIPDEFWKIERTAKLTDIKNAIKEGADFADAAHIEKRKNLQIS